MLSPESQEVAPTGAVSKENRGWFKSGDVRINREGRPRGQRMVDGDSTAVQFARKANRVRRLLLAPSDLGHRLTNKLSDWILNLPLEFEIVDAGVDAAGVHIVIRSGSFSKVARGALIPLFEPAFDGLKWRRFQQPEMDCAG